MTLQIQKRTELRKARQKLKTGKVGGKDQNTADVEVATTKLKELTDKVWRQERVPKKWTKGVIGTLPKKGDLKEFINARIGEE